MILRRESISLITDRCLLRSGSEKRGLMRGEQLIDKRRLTEPGSVSDRLGAYRWHCLEIKRVKMQAEEK